MQSGLKISKIHPQPICHCQLQNYVKTNKDLSRKYGNPNVSSPFHVFYAFWKYQFIKNNHFSLINEIFIGWASYPLNFYFLNSVFTLLATAYTYISLFWKKNHFSVKLTSSNSGLAAWWGLMRTSTVLPTAQGSMPKTKVEK